ncbi:sulfate permease-like transporter, MFS superfamily [Methanolobus tindarius DSM 2278]|uniref:Sulfate permease-like transporter, MFS superfamily n=1 Tax=Methanolobus tindarius DSM 2278 TaxID=1090322 RepID=W9DP78_METTI|nr:SulP family inorganic anion transporter [Methanolobus tindarius]ETA68029.1 sulfate permease-like transporter, MFS superfamily [Methanolobus tindarius DSM 2278]
MDIQNRVSNYLKESFTSDLKAGFITAVVALPLAIAFAIASGVEPQMGLYTAVIAGILVASTGGSRYSISGPTGAMTVIILSTLHSFELEGLLLAGFLAGAFQILFGILKLGKVVKYIPLPVISGFTSGIGAIILIGQIPNALGLVIPSKEHVWETLYAIISSANLISTTAITICVTTILLLLFLPGLMARIKYINSLPPSIIALILSVIIVYHFGFEIPLVGSIPAGLPQIRMINFNLELLMNVLPAALTIALLGAIEALLCAVVCDGMTNSRHDSNKELIGQGIANMALPFFSGIPCTAAIARSAVNIREGAKTRMSGIIHALILLMILVFLGPVAAFIPKAYLAGVLILVSLRMINIDEFKTTMSISKMDTAVLLVTFLLTVLTDLVFAVQMGMFLSIILLFIRLTNVIDIQTMENYDRTKGINATIFADPYLEKNVSVYTINGPFFFGAMNVFESKINEHMAISKPHIILRMRYVPFIDTTGIERLKSFIKASRKQHQRVYLTSVQPEVMKRMESDLELTELMEKQHVHICESSQKALEFVKKENDKK